MANGLSDTDLNNFFQLHPNPHIVMRNDDNLTVIDQNRAHAKISYTKSHDVIGKPLLVAFPDTSEKYVKTGISDLVESMRKVISTGKSDRINLLRYDLKSKSGKLIEKWWRVTHYPIFDEHNKVVSVYQFTEDITEEILSNQVHEQTRLMLESTLAIGLVSTWSWDMKRDVVIGDATLAQRFGVPKKNAERGLSLQVFLNSIHEDDRARVTAAIQRAIEHNTSYEQEYRTVTPSGEINWVIARGRVEKIEDGKPSIFSGVLFDISDRKIAEQELVESQRRYDALFNSNVVAIAMADTDGKIYQANKTFHKMFGYTDQDIKHGLKSIDVSYVKNTLSNKTMYDTIRTKGELEPTRKEYQRKDGTHFTGLVGAAKLDDSSNAFIAFILDVSENEKLKELNELKNEFIAVASHQLRTPVSTVKQYLGVLANGMAGELNEKQQKYINIANGANEREISIIDGLLKTAQLDAESKELVLHPTDLNALVTEIISSYEPMLERKNQTIKFKTDKNPLRPIPVDTSEIRTCIENLIENASKYSDVGTSVTLELHREGEWATIAVSDQGVGIAAKDQDKVFGKFTRVNNRLSDTVTGSGLGLYWVKRIAELHGGKCEVSSKVGKGTTFSIRLPV